MKAGEQPRPKLGDLVTSETTLEDLLKIVADKIITRQDEQLFGDCANEMVVIGILYPSVFAPEPATFDKEAYDAVVGTDSEGNKLREEEISQLMQIALETGLIKNAPDGRFMTDNSVAAILCELLSQYE